MRTLILFTFFLLFSKLLNAQTIFQLIDAKNYDKLSTITKKINSYNSLGQPPLFYATVKNDTTALKILIKNGADLNQLTKLGHNNATCIYYASQEGYVDIKILLEYNDNIESNEVHGCTPLRIAAKEGHVNVINYLISKGAVIDTKGDDGATPLEHAASKGHIDVVTILIKNGANINHQDNELDTPLGEAANYGHIEVVKYLLINGANKLIKNKYNYTALDRAQIAGQKQVIEILNSN